MLLNTSLKNETDPFWYFVRENRTQNQALFSWHIVAKSESKFSIYGIYPLMLLKDLKINVPSLI